MVNDFQYTHILLAIYIVCLAFINLIALLISSFYRQKFNQPSPRLGFGAAIVGLLLYAFGIFVLPDAPLYHDLHAAVLLASAAGSAWSSISLHYTMKKVRK